MFKLFGAFLLIPVIIVIAAFTLIIYLVKAFKPSGKKNPGNHDNDRYSRDNNYGDQQKEFSKDEGEYVDYEEFKEDEK